MLRLTIYNAQHELQAQCEDARDISYVYESAYQPGDYIQVDWDEAPGFLNIWLEDTLPPALVYLPQSRLRYPIPSEAERVILSPKSFSGNRQLIRLCVAEAEELEETRNLALNPYDSHHNTDCFPHAQANVETRGEMWFAARNAIDGCHENHGHGAWPYQSWGINRDPNAAMTLDFGRDVLVEGFAFTLRADFPHDAWWEQVSLILEGENEADSEELVFHLEKSDQPQYRSIEARKLRRCTLCKLIKADDPSPFPALTQLEVWGRWV